MTFIGGKGSRYGYTTLLRASSADSRRASVGNQSKTPEENVKSRKADNRSHSSSDSYMGAPADTSNTILSMLVMDMCMF